jgi:SAM-dependent methyltransferase
MKTPEEIKETVREKYGEMARQPGSGSGCCAPGSEKIMAGDYTVLEGYQPDADLGLGCGLPTQHAGIRKGDLVVDLGSGAGNDCFVARNATGAEGRVIGIDMTEAMIGRARGNAAKLGFANVEFRLGEIENIPVKDGEADVVISNCVLNLVPDKEKAFREIYRILKPGGHFSVSDTVTSGPFPERIKAVAELYTGCISGAVEREAYLDCIRRAGFRNIRVMEQRSIPVPVTLLTKYLSGDESNEYLNNNVALLSVTVYGEKS